MYPFVRLYRPLNKCICGQLKFQRTFLSPSFGIQELWNRRLDSPLLQKVKLDDMYYELDARYNQLKIISAIDVDIFVNAVKDDLHLDEVEDLVHKLRLCSEAGKILPSTHHAFIRNLLHHGDSEELIRVLNDRLNYGIFPDHYCTILMLDKFVKEGKFRDAAKIASLQMLQEDFSNPIINYYSLYACHKFILNPTEWEKQETVEEKNEDEDEDEEVRVRVDFIRNPFFDEHFDLTTSDDLIGKTMIMIGDNLPDSVGHTYKLVGQGMFKKLDSAKIHLEMILNKKEKIFEFGLTSFCDSLTKLPAKEGEDGTKQENLVKELQALAQKIQDEGLVIKEDVLVVVEQTLKKLIAEKEPEILKTQMEIYDQWDINREHLLKMELEEVKRVKRLEEVQKAKVLLEKKEEELFFFENENELDLKIENKRVPYPPKWHGSKKKKRERATDYVPPEV